VRLNLVCLVAHASVPALVPGNTTCFTDRDLVIPHTPAILRRLASAVRDRALVVAAHAHPTLDEIEADVLARHAVLMARLDREIARRHRARLRLAS